MIDQFIATQMISVVKKYNISGDAFSFGKQVTCFSLEWLKKMIPSIENSYVGQEMPRIRDSGTESIPTKDFFNKIGFQKYYDIDYNGKAEINWDLGKPIDPHLHGKADLLYDGGVIEHIPDIFQAIENIMLLLKVGGIFIGANPVCYYGGSYYMIDPLLFKDIYAAKGFEMISCYLLCDSLKRQINKRVLIENIIRPFIPLRILNKRRERLKKEWTDINAGTASNIENEFPKVVISDPFSKTVASKINLYGGLPFGLMVLYIGRKTLNIEQGKIKITPQHIYPKSEILK